MKHKKLYFSKLEKFKLRVWDLFIVLVILLIASKFWIFLSARQLIELLLSILAFNYIGKCMLLPTVILKTYNQFLLTGFSILLGGFCVSLGYVFCHYFNCSLIFYKFFVFLVGLFSVTHRFDWNFDRNGFLTSLPCFVFLLNIDERSIPSNLIFYDLVPDSFYYNAITKSLSVDWSIFSSVFHIGIPYNYQILTYFFPATLVSLVDLPAHFALWGVFLPLVKVFSFATVSFTISNLLLKDLIVKVVKLDLFYFITSFSLIGLAALNPKYLLKVDLAHSLFLGEGFLTPMGSIGYGLIIWLFGVALYLFSTKEFVHHRFDVVFFIILIAFSIVVKVAFFFPMMLFFGFLLCFKYLKFDDNKGKFLGILAISFFCALIIHRVFFGSNSDMVKLKICLGGFYFDYFKSKAIQYGLPSTNGIVCVISLYIFMIWLGLKMFISLFFYLNKGIIPVNYRYFLICSFLTFLFSFSPGFIFRILCLDENGLMLLDGSFDLAEFTRSGVFILNAAFSGIVGLVFFAERVKYSVIIRTLIVIWCFFAYIGFFNILNERQVSWDRSRSLKWEFEVKKSFKEINPELMAMICSEEYSCITLVSRDVYPWWTYGKRAKRTDYVMSNVGNYRANMVLKLIDSNTSISDCRLLVKNISKEGVDFLVSTPKYDSRFKFLSSKKVLINSGFKWFYKLP